jgi:hypothetical protein
MRPWERTTLGAAQGAGVGRLGQVRHAPGTLEFLDEVAPAGGGFQRERGRLAVELCKPGAHLHAPWRG